MFERLLDLLYDKKDSCYIFNTNNSSVDNIEFMYKISQILGPEKCAFNVYRESLESHTLGYNRILVSKIGEKERYDKINNLSSHQIKYDNSNCFKFAVGLAMRNTKGSVRICYINEPCKDLETFVENLKSHRKKISNNHYKCTRITLCL